MVGGAVLVAVTAGCIVLAYCWRLKRNENVKLKHALQQSQVHVDPRYTDLPKMFVYRDFKNEHSNVCRHDAWELERRNLVIHDDKKLGSGAFGAVFLGRLIGQAKGGKDAQSTLGVNFARAENCAVAVKMLPRTLVKHTKKFGHYTTLTLAEYADDLCKSEFLHEISLMKTLGYHERLVNMLACVTATEPYCLVVEFCSDGDLLNYLRERVC